MEELKNEYHKVFSGYLGEKIDPSTRTNARQKLTLLSENQFGELATDIHDELKRRISSENIPFLQVRSDYHPKRNQARQKLATLPEKRFKDLVIDVIIELERRFPELVTSQDTPVESSPSPLVTPKQEPAPIQQQQQPQQSPQRNLIQKEARQPTPSDLNFASLDSLMKDLGDLVTGNGDSVDDLIPAKKSKKATESMMSLENLPKSEDSAKIRKEKELVEKKYKLLEADFDKERAKLSLCQKELNTSQIELQKAKAELEGISSKRGVVEKELVRVKDLLENEKMSRANENNQAQSKISGIEFELNEHKVIIKNMGMVSDERQKALDDLTAQNNKFKLDLEHQKSEVTELRKKLQEYERKPVLKQSEQGSQTNLLEIGNKSEKSEKSPVLADIKHQDKGLERSTSKTGKYSDSKLEKQSTEKLDKIAPLENKPTSSLPDPRAVKIANKMSVDINHLPWQVQRKTIIVSQILDSVTIEDITPLPKGGVVPSRLAAYQSSVDNLIESQKSGVPADILVSMKAIVIACKNITNDVEKYEVDAPADQKESLTGLKGQLSGSLTHLMSAAKNHATGLAKGAVKGSSEEIDKGCVELTTVIINILKIVKIKAEKDDENIPLKKLKDIIQQTPDSSPSKTATKTVMSSADLKVFHC